MYIWKPATYIITCIELLLWRSSREKYNFVTVPPSCCPQVNLCSCTNKFFEWGQRAYYTFNLRVHMPTDKQ